MRRIVGISVLAALLVLPGSAFAAHNGNNRADLDPRADADADGSAIVNYREGTGTFNGRTSVLNLAPSTDYFFVVRLGENEGSDQLICSGTSNRKGKFVCQAQNLSLAGFNEAVIEDAAGNDVAAGIFARRGNCRDPDQGGSQCNAPGQNR